MILPPDTIESINENDNVHGMMNYVTPSTTLVSTHRDLAGSDAELQGAEFVPTCVKVHNGRLFPSLNLHQHGFQLLQNNIHSLDIDFYDQQDVIQQYYPHCEDLLKSFLSENQQDEHSTMNTVQVIAFDHNVRSNKGAGETRLKQGGGATVQNPAGLVHADYTKVSAPRRLQQLAKSTTMANDVRQSSNMESQMILQEALEGKRRYAFINVWRNIAHEKVQMLPLACMDATTVTATRDLRTFQIHYTDRVGENYFCCPSPQHKWYYYPQMTRNEVLLLKQWDSKGDMANGHEVDKETSTMTVHSAFMDPTSPADAPPRESIEVRCIVIWEE